MAILLLVVREFDIELLLLNLIDFLVKWLLNNYEVK